MIRLLVAVVMRVMGMMGRVMGQVFLLAGGERTLFEGEAAIVGHDGGRSRVVVVLVVGCCSE